ncbi:MAG TPA: hypothetical protein VGL15_16530 [Vicinamibacteria bacterium]
MLPAVRYAAFAVLALLGPGLAAQRLADVAVDAALVLPLGFAITAGAYWLSLVAGIPWLFPVIVAALDLALLVGRGPWSRAPGPSFRGAIAPFVATLALLAATQYRWNRLAETGEFLLDPIVPFDTAFHVGVTRELTIGYPPQVPGLAGFTLGYHFGIDLVRAAALRWAAVDPYDSIARFDVTLGALALVLAVRAAARAAGASPLAVAIVPWTLLATDFSFVFAGNPSAIWWTDLLRGNVLLSLALANPVVPALSLALGALAALHRYTSGEGRGWLAVAVALAFAVPFFKVFLGAHLLLGLLAAAVLGRRDTRAALAAVAAPCAIGTAMLALGQGGRTVAVALAPLDLVRATRESLNLTPLSGARLAGWSVFWLFASLGLRLVGVPAAARALRRGPPVAVVLGAMALAGWPLGLLFRVSAPEVLAGQKVVNDAAYLVEQAGPLLWIFTGMTLAAWSLRPVLGLPLLTLSLMLALPATVQFVWASALHAPDRLPAATVRAMDSLRAASAPGEVVLQRPGARYPPAPVILIGRRVPYERFTPYLTQFAPAAALVQRHETVYRFFHTDDVGEATQIARDLSAKDVCLYGPDRLRFDAGSLLEPIHEEPDARCYRLVPPGLVTPVGLSRMAERTSAGDRR